ncbi:MAG: PepSY domain-containing protein, partial [Gammaproteobacteria bacterium]|nr:PepSY domain-containing protein [Gammaproteobacteria bacterium]
MNNWQRWVQAPNTTFFRRALFQIHLWLGIALGLYILVISVSGSAVVLRPQFSRWFIASEVSTQTGEALAGSELEARVAEVYRDYSVTN